MIEKIKNHLLNGVLLLVLFSSCKKEVSLEIQQESQSNLNEFKSLVSQVKFWHDSTVSSSLKTKAQNGVRAFSVNENDIVPPIVDWEKAFINFDSSTVKSITVPISMNYKNGEHMQLVATKSKNKINGYFIKVTPDSTNIANQIDPYNYFNFNGSISIYNLMGIGLKKQNFKTGISLKSNNSSNSTFSSIKTYEYEWDGGYLPDFFITSYKKKNRYNYGLIYINYQQNIQSDEGEGGGEVIAGGSDLTNYFIPEGMCVFGALAKLGELFGGSDDPNHYVKQYGDNIGKSKEEVLFDILSTKNGGPDIIEAVKLLQQVFEAKNLTGIDNMIKVATETKNPIFVLIDWKNDLKTGHNIIVQWKDDRLQFFDPVGGSYSDYLNSNEYANSVYFYEVTALKK
jgi:hypothetical protein